MGKERYIRVILGNGDEIFVLEKDYRKIGKCMKEEPFDSKKMVTALFESLISSPEAMSRLSKATFRMFDIMDICSI